MSFHFWTRTTSTYQRTRVKRNSTRTLPWITFDLNTCAAGGSKFYFEFLRRLVLWVYCEGRSRSCLKNHLSWFYFHRTPERITCERQGWPEISRITCSNYWIRVSLCSSKYGTDPKWKFFIPNGVQGLQKKIKTIFNGCSEFWRQFDDVAVTNNRASRSLADPLATTS